MIEIIPITSREQWLADRLPAVNASEAPALLGIHPYISPFQLYVEKSGALADDAEISGPMERGLLLEPVAIEKLRRDHPDWEIWNPACYYRNPKTRMGATPDAFVKRPDRPGFGSLQFKSVEPGVFKRTWQVDGTIEPPLWIVVQAAIERELTGADYCMVVPLIIGHVIDVHLIEIPIAPSLITRLEGEVAEFWQRVQNRRPPDVTSPNDAAVLTELYPHVGGTISLRDDNELVALADEDDDLRAKIKIATDRRAIIKGRFLAAMGDAGLGLLSDGRCLVRKRIEKTGYVVEPSSYISIKVKEPKS